MYGCHCNIGCLRGEVTRIGKGICGVVTRISKGISGYVSIVCSTNKDEYLGVKPDVVWLTSDMLSSAEFEIYANIVWNIV